MQVSRRNTSACVAALSRASDRLALLFSVPRLSIAFPSLVQ
jgi:hypothetical protein